MKLRARAGIGVNKRQANVITVEEEDRFWNSGVLGSDTPRKLLHTMFYVVGLNFALRGGEEHRSLKHGTHSQLGITEIAGKKALCYKQDYAKNQQGGLQDHNKPRKIVYAYENPANPERCPVRIYETYLSRCPKPYDSLPSFYLRPLTKPGDNVWFCRSPVGRHTLSSVVSTICAEAKIGGYRTNHSLRATAATRLFDANVDEQLITEVTGHRSSAVREYKRTSNEKRQKVSGIIQAGPMNGVHMTTATVTQADTMSASDGKIVININMSECNKK